ncbi:MAG: hypothetical protein MUO63_14895 [Desulfobulbaceae bacterium]|nr:hypothetical protein [Desulfobulbaceae bacterium]
MNKITALVLIFCFFFSGTIASATGYILFPEENIPNLTLIATDTESASFTLQNKEGEQAEGYVGDAVGMQDAIVIAVHPRFILVETFETVTNNSGRVIERPSRMKIPLAFVFHGKGVQ